MFIQAGKPAAGGQATSMAQVIQYFVHIQRFVLYGTQ